MKKNLIQFGLALILMGLNSCSDNSSASSSSAQTPGINEEKDPNAEPNSIEGGWYLIYGEYGGVKRDNNKPIQFKLFGDKYFSFLMDSGDENWNYASTGTYSIDGNIYSEKFEFSTNPAFRGVYAEWKFDLSGDTLIMEGPTKILDVDGNEAPELAGGYNTMKEIRVKAK